MEFPCLLLPLLQVGLFLQENLLPRTKFLFLLYYLLFFVLQFGVLVSDFALIYAQFYFRNFDQVFNCRTVLWLFVQHMLYHQLEVL